MANAKLIDLGLPSGTLWADRNVGSETPEGIGHYVTWGGVKPHAEGDGYFEDNYDLNQIVKVYHDEEVDVYPDRWEKIEVAGEVMYKSLTTGEVKALPEGWEYDEETRYIYDPEDPTTREPHKETVKVCKAHKEIVKYNESDQKVVLEDAEDAATVEFGSLYKTPTKKQWQELFDYTKMTVEDGVAKFTAANGHYIVLPIAGCRHEHYHCTDGLGEYWANGITDNFVDADRAVFGTQIQPRMMVQWRIIGLQVRPVGK